MGKKQSKRQSVERHIKVNPQASAKSVSKATGVSYNYAYKIMKELKETVSSPRKLAGYPIEDMATPSIATQAGEIYERRKDMNAVREQVRKLEEQDQVKQSSAGKLDLDRGTLTVPWSTFTTVGSDPDLIGKLPPIGEAVSDGSTASYYVLPTRCTELQHLISHKDMNAQIGEIFRSCYRYGESSHSSKLRDAKKIKFYIDAEIARLGA